MYPPRLVENESYELPLTLARWVVSFFVHLRGYLQANAPFVQSLFVASFVVEVSCAKLGMEPFLDPGRGIKDLFGGVDLRWWRIFRRTKMLRISLCYSTALASLITYVMIILQHPDHRDSPILFLGSPRGLKTKAYFWERIEAPMPPSRPRCTFTHPRQLSPFLERLELPCFK